MAKIHFDITGDNSDFVSSLNDTSKRLETFSDMMKDLGESGLDMSGPKEQLRSLQHVIEENEEIIRNYQKQIDELEQAQKAAALAGDTEQVAAYGREIDTLAQAMQSVINTTNQQKTAFNELTGAMDKEEGVMVKLLGGQEKFDDIMKGLPPSLKGAVNGLNGMTKAAKAFIATPLGAILAAIVLAYKALSTWLHKTSEGQKVLTKLTGYFSGIMAALEQIVKKIGQALYNAFTNPKEAIKSFVQFLKDQVVNRVNALGGMFKNLGKIIAKTFTGNFEEVKEAAKELGDNVITFYTGVDASKVKKAFSDVADIAKKQAELAERARNLSIERVKWEEKEAELERQINEQRNKMYSGSKVEQDAASAKAQALINAMYAQRIKFAEEEYNIRKETNALTDSSQEELNEEEHLKGQIAKLKAEREGALAMFKRRGSSAADAAIAAEIKEENELNAIMLQNQEKRISMLKDEGTRTVEQINANFEKEMDAIRKRRTQWEEDNRKAKGTSELSEAQKTALREAEKLAAFERQRAFEDYSKSEYQKFVDYLKEYGSFEEKKLAITLDYEKKIREAREAGDVYGEQELLKQRKAKLAALDASKLLDETNMATVFSDLGLVLTAPLKETVEQLRKYTQTNDFTNRTIEEQKSIYQAIAKAEEKLGSLDSLDYRSLGESIQAYTMAMRRKTAADQDSALAASALAVAESKLAEARKKGDNEAIEVAENERQIALARRTAADEEYQNAASEYVRTQAEATAAVERFNAAVNRISSGIRQLYDGKLAGLWNILGPDFANKLGMIVSGSKGVIDSFNTLGNTLKEKGSSIDDFAKKAGDVFEEIFSKFDDKSEGLKKGVEAVERMFAYEGAEELGKKAGKDLQEGLSEELKNGKTAKELGKTVTNAVSGIGAAAESSGNVYGMLIALFLDLMDEFKEHGIGDIVTTLLQNIGDAVEGILTHMFENLEEIITKGVTSLVSGFFKGQLKFVTLGLFNDEIDSLFGQTGLSDEEIEKLTKSNQALEKAINDLKTEISKADATSMESIDAYKKAIEAENQKRDNLQKLIYEQAGAYKKGFFGVGGEHSSLYHMEMDIDQEQYRKIEELLGRNLGSNKLFGLLGMTPEEWKMVADYLPSIYGEILAAGAAGYEDISEYIEQYVEEAGKLEELEFSLGEKLTGISWDSFLSDFKSVLKDMDSDAEDFAENFEKILSDAILDSLVNEKYRDRLKKLYQTFVDYSQEGSEGGTALTLQEENELKRMREQIASDALEERQRLLDLGLITNESKSESQRNATAGGFQTMSQDMGTELNGRFTALQVAGENIYKQTIQGVELIKSIQQMLGGSGGALSEIRNLHLLEVGYLEDIAKQTKPILTFGDKLDKIDRNTSKL